MALGVKQEVNWLLQSVDTKEIFRPQFPVDGDFQISTGAVLSEQSRVGFQDSLLAWTAGRVKTFTFSIRLFSRYIGEDIKSQIELLQKFADKDAGFGRPHILALKYGTLVSVLVMIDSLDHAIRDTHRNGDPKDVRTNIVLKKYVPFSKRTISPTKTKKESFYFVATEALNSYEAIAKRFYGDALAGDRLRKRHPEKPMNPDVGDIVRVPSRDLILSEVVQPESFILDRDDIDAVENQEKIQAARNKRKLVVVR